MVVFLLSMRADLDNVESVSFPDSSQWCLDVRTGARAGARGRARARGA